MNAVNKACILKHSFSSRPTAKDRIKKSKRNQGGILDSAALLSCSSAYRQINFSDIGGQHPLHIPVQSAREFLQPFLLDEIFSTRHFTHRAATKIRNKKPTVSKWTLSASRVFPVDDSARVESLSVCMVR
jgi:hypothetical protein